ncbi:GNAT family N-acetyltransferase [Ktedonobacter racemifer]|uniref:GCN5-related N-acetyltransferase n=1 Tax=Ktedonobacter racemifer DSM 44963 TaxID=485913 RepID=D6TGX4_KTERA|nr:GNAT family protein [Ktedonobacter racemifer]EFH88903.1 GCN5-related N-acetyltransferase [Ktedonobacter racemifer DSM 44963]
MTNNNLKSRTPFIEGDRIRLCLFDPKRDFHLLSSWHNKEEIRRYFSTYPCSNFTVRKGLESSEEDYKEFMFGIEMIDSNRLIGLVGLESIDYINRNAELYLLIGERSLWNRGYGTEAEKLMLHYGFMELNLNRIYTLDMEENLAARKSDEKAGLKYEFTMRDAILKFGRYHNVFVYSILKKEYLSVFFNKNKPISTDLFSQNSWAPLEQGHA